MLLIRRYFTSRAEQSLLRLIQQTPQTQTLIFLVITTALLGPATQVVQLLAMP